MREYDVVIGKYITHRTTESWFHICEDRYKPLVQRVLTGIVSKGMPMSRNIVKHFRIPGGVVILPVGQSKLRLSGMMRPDFWRIPD